MHGIRMANAILFTVNPDRVFGVWPPWNAIHISLIIHSILINPNNNQIASIGDVVVWSNNLFPNNIDK